MNLARAFLLVVMASASMGSAALAAADLSDRQSAAAAEQDALRSRIEQLQKDIDQRESDRQEAADALKTSETAISRINRRLAELDAERTVAQTQLDEFKTKIGVQEGVLAERQAQLANQLRAQYASGLSPWTALLSGDDAQALGRNLGYLEFVSQERARTLAAIQKEIEHLAALQREADAKTEQLNQVASNIQKERGALVSQQKERATVLARLEGQISAQRSEAVRLGRDDQRLSRLIGDIEVAIVEQARQAEAARQKAAEEARQRAEEIRRNAEVAREAQRAQQAEEAKRLAEAHARADAARQQAEAAQAADAERRSAETAKRVQEAQAQAKEAAQAREQAEAEIEKSRSTPRGGLISARGPLIDSEARASLARPAPRAAEAATGQGLSRNMRPPVQGETQGRFGVGRPDGGTWRGVVIRAAEGTPVEAVAPGTVVYAQWLRGFGNLIIVDHGSQYMTVYAYNQSLQKQVGDKVGARETVATVGATGGQVESGLYFEIRHQGAPVDPAQWLAR